VPVFKNATPCGSFRVRNPIVGRLRSRVRVNASFEILSKGRAISGGYLMVCVHPKTTFWLRRCCSYPGGVDVDAAGRPAVAGADPGDGRSRGRAEQARDDRRLLRHRAPAGTAAGQATSPRRTLATATYPS